MLHDEAQKSPPWVNGTYSVKRHGTTLDNCDAEPIQTPGCIQAHGALLILRATDLNILQVSENSMTWFGVAPETLLGQPVSVAVGAEGQEHLRECLANAPVDCNPLHAFSFTRTGDGVLLDVLVHTIGNVAIVEIEEAELGEGGDDYYVLLKTTIARLHTASTLLDFCGQVASEVRNLNGLDRVMVYRFHPDHHGEVYAESRREDLAPWLGLHYPAEDIPKSVRDIFTKIWIRPLPDVNAELVELVPLMNPDTGKAVELTYCALRGASVMYTEYLHNMGVAASLTMPILREGELFGLIACHHYTPTQFSYRKRAVCEFLAQAVSLQIKSIEDREQLMYRVKLDKVHSQLINAAIREECKLEVLIEGYPNLLDGVEANGVALFHRGRWWLGGRTPNEKQLNALAIWLESRCELTSVLQPCYVTDELARDYPESQTFAGIASGLLAVSLSRKSRLLMLWFRSETLQTIHWAGNPHDKPAVLGPNGPRLTPRVSFDLFLESVRGRSMPWKAVEVEAVLRLRLLVMELVIDRSERLAELNADLTRSNYELDAFNYVVSHDLKEPLRGIAKYARQLLENAEAMDEVQHQRLEGLIRLTQRMDTLLNGLLRFSRIGRGEQEIAPTKLGDVIQEVLIMLRVNRIGAVIVVSSSMPTVNCDRMQIREVFYCLIDNALKYNDHKLCRVEIGSLISDSLSPDQNGSSKPTTIYYVKDNGIGIESHFLVRIFDLFRRLHGRELYGGGAGTGLAIAKLLIERHHGRIWVESVPGEGSTFYFTLGQEPIDTP